jgi:hypothetical protein
MTRTFAGLLLLSSAIAAGSLALPGRAGAQVVIQGEGQAGGVYGQGTVYVQPQGQVQAQPQQQQVYAQPSPYVATQQAQPQPVRTILHRSPTMMLLIPGVIALGAGWLFSGLGTSSIAGECYYDCPNPLGDWVGYSWIPIVGPWIAYGTTYTTAGYEWINFLTGIVQGAGVVMIVLGLVIQQEWEEAVYADLGNGVGISFDAGLGGASATLSF